MTDIVERLRGDPGPADTLTELIRTMVEQRHEAADEIRLLQTANDCAFEELAKLRAENTRLRDVVNDQSAAIVAAIGRIERLQAELADVRADATMLRLRP